MNNQPAYYQLCPKCNGDGHLGRYNSPGLSSTVTPPCDACNGAKVVLVNVPEPSRAQIAAMAMQGFLSGKWSHEERDFEYEDFAEWSVKQADALLAELSKPPVTNK